MPEKSVADLPPKGTAPADGAVTAGGGVIAVSACTRPGAPKWANPPANAARTDAAITLRAKGLPFIMHSLISKKKLPVWGAWYAVKLKSDLRRYPFIRKNVTICIAPDLLKRKMLHAEWLQ
jgi:hypothetical protein